MPFFKSHPADAGPANVFTAHPEIYAAWAEMSEALMNGPSPLSQGERELLLAYAAAVAGCRFVFVAHSEVACARGIERGLIDCITTTGANARAASFGCDVSNCCANSTIALADPGDAWRSEVKRHIR